MRAPLLFAFTFFAVLACSQNVSAQQDDSKKDSITIPPVDPNTLSATRDDYSSLERADRKTFVVSKNQRGTTVRIPEETVKKFCSDKDGCTIRIGMHNWNDTGRVASRHYIFFYNPTNRAWKVESPPHDPEGTNQDNVTTHVNQSWSCYLTDGQYSNWADIGDSDSDFGLLSWNQYNADCYLTIID